MTNVTISSVEGGERKVTEIAFAISVVLILLILFLPIPPILVDIGIAISIALSVVILMLALWISRPLEFSSFPTILLVATLLRLALNIATTRLILADGAEGVTAAGNIIGGFSSLVMAGDFIIGLTVFLILVIVNFVVITKGATRIAEVGARFTLDAIPGKQMAIDADLSAGTINEMEAQARRRELEEESAFFGAMDGASKFVRGDAIAGVIILAINIFGGILIGVFRHNLPISEAADIFTKLSVGDGLAAQIPALIVSLAAGLLVSKGGTRVSAEKAILTQVGGYPRAVFIAAILMFLLGFMPGLPFLPFVMIGLSLWLVSRIALIKQQTSKKESLQPIEAIENDETSAAMLIDELKVAQVELVLGKQVGAILLSSHNELSHRVSKLRKKFVREYGFLIPEIRLTDDVTLEPKKYQVKIHGSVVGEYEIRPGQVLVVVGRDRRPSYPGDETKEPAFNMDALWIPEQLTADLQSEGFKPIDTMSIILTHVSEIISSNLAQLLSYKDVRMLIEKQDPIYRRLVDDLCPAQISYSVLQAIMKGLLAERVSIRSIDLILEAIAEIVPQTTRADAIIEHVRMCLAPQISSMFSQDGVLNLVSLGSDWEMTFSKGIRRNERGEVIEFDVDPEEIERFRKEALEKLEQLSQQNIRAVLVTSAESRPYVRLITERFLATISVISHLEIAKGMRAQVVGTLAT